MELKSSIPQEKAFYINDNLFIYSINELLEALENNKISDDVFAYHVTDGKNDFAKWINDVFENKTLAKELKRIKTKKGAIKKLKKVCI